MPGLGSRFLLGLVGSFTAFVTSIFAWGCSAQPNSEIATRHEGNTFGEKRIESSGWGVVTDSRPLAADFHFEIMRHMASISMTSPE